MRQQGYRGTGFLVLLLLMAALFMIQFMPGTELTELSSQQFETLLENGSIYELSIRQNEQTPTGRVDIVTRDGSAYQVYVSDVNETQRMLDEQGLDYTLRDVSQSSYWMSV
ncbi:MAG: hypothetical protein LUC94_06570, partial [Clostridiales bacterium]|nr:hypothetical protein [Clostridiales bacterium]